MHVKILLLVTVLLVFAAQHTVTAAFYPDHEPPTADQLGALGLNCIPGRTVMKVSAARELTEDSEEEGDVDTDARRTHMNAASSAADEACQICVCSTDGRAEYCSKRPARNVNECIRMATITEEFNHNIPYDHERILSQMIRRDFIWHKDEIPLASDSKCLRGSSYYTNNPDAEEAKVNLESSVESLLDYNDSNCTFCVCSVSGTYVSCIPRDPWICDYYRSLRSPDAVKNMYTKLFKQERPSYFYHISYRIRRTMDQGVFDILDGGGDALCCDHPNGHRRNIHVMVKKRIQHLKRKVPFENLMDKTLPREDYADFIVNNDK